MQLYNKKVELIQILRFPPPFLLCHLGFYVVANDDLHLTYKQVFTNSTSSGEICW